nr:zinc finger BED domain-containing protein RICESLEEPER 2 [Tanacetum cinerariifolium]
MSDNTKKAQCIHCLHFFSKDSNSTLKNHISHPHREALKRDAEPGQSSMSRDGSTFVYNLNVLRGQFTSLVIQRGLPFNHFDDKQTTRVFQKHLQPKYNHVSRTTLKPGRNFFRIDFERILSENVPARCNGADLYSAGKKWFTDSFEGLYNIYYTKYGNPTTTESNSRGGGSSSRASHRNQVTSLLRRLKEHKNKKARSDPSLSSKHERYVHSDFVTHLQTTKFENFDVLGFWKAKETMFLVLSRIAMDILSVQATSVASESAFSTSGRVLSIRRTRLTSASLEMCMCLKDHLDAQERKQDKSTLETPVDFKEEVLDADVLANEAIILFDVVDFKEEVLDADVLANEAIPLSDEEIALDAASSEGSMSEPGSRGEEAEVEVNYGYDVYHDDY